jgi:hypothetical protein
MPDPRVWALCLLAAPAAAQDGALQRTLELPAHRLLMEVVAAPGTQLTPFVSDGCSGGLSSSWRVVADLVPGFAEAHQPAPPWESCCVAHDRAYHAAGGARTAEASYDARLEADTTLRTCVEATGQTRLADLAARYGGSETQVRRAYSAIAGGMFTAVRLGGGPCSGLPWAWGFGYPGCLTP